MLHFIHIHFIVWLVGFLICVGYICFKYAGGQLWTEPKHDGYEGTNVFMTIIFWICVTSFLFVVAWFGAVIFGALLTVAMFTK